MPSGHVYRRLADTIVQLSKEYSSPAFQPHLTLLGRIVTSRRDALARTAHLARSLRPFTIRLGALQGLDEYYRCLFVRAANTDPLWKAYRAAQRIFSAKQRPAFMPHFSLMYGDFPAGLKKEVIRRLGGRLGLRFEVRSLRLYSTTGKPRAWRQLKAFRLS